MHADTLRQAAMQAAADAASAAAHLTPAERERAINEAASQVGHLLQNNTVCFGNSFVALQIVFEMQAIADQQSAKANAHAVPGTSQQAGPARPAGTYAQPEWGAAPQG